MALAERGAHLALSDIDSEALDDTATAVADKGITVSSHVVDVADRDAVYGWADAVVEQHGAAHLIINNAGVTLMSTVAAMDDADFAWLMDINFWGVVHGTKAFLPHLRAAGEGHVVNISSVFGLQAIPGQAAYNAAKFAVRGFTDALRIELEAERCGVSATTIHPGGIRTNIARRARSNGSMGPQAEAVANFDRVAKTSPEKAAEQILNAVQKNRRRALIGPDAVVFDAVSRLPASLAQRLLIVQARRGREAAARSSD